MSIASFLSGRGQRLSRHMQNRLSTWRTAYARAQTRYARPVLCDPLEPRMLLSGTYSYVDLAGHSVLATLTGAGAITVDNAGTDHASVSLTGTNTGSTLKFTVLNSGVASTTDIAGLYLNDGTLGSLVAGNVNLTGFGISGGPANYINNMTLGSISSGAIISLGGIGRSATKITVGTVGDGALFDIAQAISTASFASFGDGKIQTKSISKLIVAGNFNADLRLTGNAINKTVVLGSATIGGNVANVTWDFTGSANYITVAGTMTAPNISISGNLYQLSAGSIVKNIGTDTTFNLYVPGQISKIKVAGSMSDGNIYSNIIGSISTGGDFTVVNVSVGNNVTKASTVALNSLTVGGTFDNTGANLWAAHGSINSVKAAHVVHGQIQIDGAGRLASLTITGTGSSTLYITAGTVGNIISAGDVDGTLNLGASITAENVLVLNQLKLAGNFSGNIIAQHGSVNSLSAASFTFDELAMPGSISKITSTGNVTGKDASSSIDTSIIGTWTVGGALSNIAVNLGTGTAYTSRSVLGTLKVTGAMTGVTITSTYGGAGTISAASSSDSVYDFHNGNVGKLIFTGTQDGGDVQAQSINTWTVGGDLTGLTATLATNAKLHGYNALQNLTVTGMMGGLTVNATYGGAGTISGGVMMGSSFNFADGRINKLESKGGQSGGSVSAQSINLWTVTGNLSGLTDVTLATSDKMHGYYAISNLNVTGGINGTTFYAKFGGAKYITAGSTDTSSFNFADGRIAALTVKGTQSGGTVKAMSLGTWSVGTDLTGVTATLATASTMHGYQALSKLIVGGTMSTTSITATYGGMGSYSIGTMGAGNTLSFADGRLEKVAFKNDINGLTLAAASIGTLNITGNLVDSDITITGTANKNALESLTVTGAMNNTTLITANGGLKYLTVGSMADGTISAAKGRIESLTVTGDMTNAVTSHQQVIARSLGTWAVNGNMTGANAQLGDSTTVNSSNSLTLVLSYLTVGKTISDSTINAIGSIYSIVAQKLQDSTITAGYNTGTSAVTTKEDIVSLKITGDGTYDSQTFSNNVIAAYWIENLSAVYPDDAHVSSIRTFAIYTSLKVTQRESGSDVVHSYTTTLTSTPADAATALKGLSFTWLPAV